jgi:hypothetical protein
MNCFEFRRLMLANPRTRSPGQERHIAECAACSSFAREMDLFEERLHEAAYVPAPEALADRVLLRRRMKAPALRTWALAASFVAAVGLGVYVYQSPPGTEDRVVAASSVNDTHPAVAAIQYVADFEPQLLREGRRGDPSHMYAALQKLGLRLPTDGISVSYLGECPVQGGTGEHIVLHTRTGQVTLILIPDLPVGPRVVVADRDMTAVAAPVRTGGYVLVADSLTKARQIEGMIRL